jgi:hypothetical protein
MQRILKTKVIRNPAMIAALSSGAARSSATEAAPAESGPAVLQVMRFDPATNTKRIDSYHYVKKHEFMVLDLLTAIKAHQDPSLAFRASCCEGVCGSCAMNINGVNSLACVTYAEHHTSVGPLPNFPVMKDLVVDLKNFFKQYEYIRPFVRNVNLSRYRIASIFNRYQAAAKAIYGAPVPEAALPKPMFAPTELSRYLTLLDKVVQVGDVAKVVTVLKQLKARGYNVTNETSKAAVLEAIQNFNAKK